jgi:hypothetical protein
VYGKSNKIKKVERRERRKNCILDGAKSIIWTLATLTPTT